MGYDMTLVVGEVDGEATAMRAARDQSEAHRAYMDSIPEAEHGSWFSPEEEALSLEEKKALNEAKTLKMDALMAAGTDWTRARQLVLSVPPSQRWMEACEETEKLTSALYAANVSYFRLNIWGMSAARELMWQFKMLKESPYDSSEWSEIGLDWDQPKNELLNDLTYDAVEGITVADVRIMLAEATGYQKEAVEAAGEITDADIEAVLEYRRKQKELLARHDNDTPGISIHKLGSNDGWIVTKGECYGALLGLKTFREESEENETLVRKAEAEHSWWPRWVEYIRLGSITEGFVVR